MLELKNISLKWTSPKEDEFIKNLNLKVEKGKILTIFGVSGVGKSSLINVISGIFEDNLSFRGDIILNNKRLKSIYDLMEGTPLMIGFGIKTKVDIENVHQFADGAIIGSAYLKALEFGKEEEFLSVV